MNTVSKSRFKARALEYFRQVESSGEELIITDRGKPVLKLTRYAERPMRAGVLRDSVVRYDAPTEPLGEDEWEATD